MARPRLCPAWGKGVGQRDRRTHFLNSGNSDQRLPLEPQLWLLPVCPSGLLGKALVQEALLGSGEVRSPSKLAYPLFPGAVEGLVPGPA